MTKTHLLLSAAGVLSIGALLTSQLELDRPIQRPPTPARVLSTTVPRLDSEPPLVVHDQSAAVKIDFRLSHAHPLDGAPLWAQYDVTATEGSKHVAPVEVMLVLDHSGSMQGAKMIQARAAANQLIDLLSPTDQMGVVAFDSGLIRFAPVKADATGKEQLHRFVNQIEANSGTCISCGLEAARELLAGAREVTPRVVLITDGIPTEGDVDPAGLGRQAANLKNNGVTVTALGIGADYGAALLNGLASEGGGFFGFLGQENNLAEVLSKELSQARQESLREVSLKVKVEGMRVSDVPGRSFHWNGDFADISLANLSPGQTQTVYLKLEPVGRPETVTVAPELQYGFEDKRYAKEVSLRANPTSNAALSMNGVDDALVVQSVRIAGSQEMVKAAEAIASGDREKAYNLLASAKALFGTRADALAGEMSDSDSTLKKWKTLDDTSARYDSHMLEKKKMVNFGNNNAY